jgi:hypothetical protein
MTDLQHFVDDIMNTEDLCWKSADHYFYTVNILDGTPTEDIVACFQNRFTNSTDFLNPTISWIDNYIVDYHLTTGVCVVKNGIRVRFTKSDSLKMTELNTAVDNIINAKGVSVSYNIIDGEEIASGTRITDIIACFQRIFPTSRVYFSDLHGSIRVEKINTEDNEL